MHLSYLHLRGNPTSLDAARAAPDRLKGLTADSERSVAACSPAGVGGRSGAGLGRAFQCAFFPNTTRQLTHI